ncbi:uncharacterized protein TNCV_5070601 [Trichonephila clavipes]|nr:uncharacterized protein TNCV_5070601 [Trichonephila clavipes]
MPPNTLRLRMEYVHVKLVGPKVLWAESRVQGIGEYFPPLQFHNKIMEVEIGAVAIYRPFGNFTDLNCTVTCMGLKVNDRCTSSQCHDGFRGPRSDCVKHVLLETTTATQIVYFLMTRLKELIHIKSDEVQNPHFCMLWKCELRCYSRHLIKV